jgi:NitT/TauT family transport system permease protein/putative hydroxymethylpyrimidine transport system permease protein
MLLAALIGAWQIAASSGALADLLKLESFLVPSPAEIAESLWQSRSLLAENAWVTLREMLFGLACAILAGVALAVAMHLWAGMRRTVYPLIVTSQTIPILVIAPILVVWFGYGIGPKLWIIALICFFPITVSTLDGLGSVDPEATKMMRTLDASRGQILWRLEGPASLPGFFTGAKVAVAIAAIGAVFAEWAGSNAGLGHLILIDNGQLETARVFAAMFVLAAMTIALYGLLALAERRIVTWR